jgi:8-oxo-dGTP diphosphatase
MSEEDHFHLGVKALIQNVKGEILILQVDPKKFAVYSLLHWDLPGGRIQKNESLEGALRREVKEEIGWDQLNIIRPFCMALSPRRISYPDRNVGLILSIYECEAQEMPISLSEEHIDFEWVAPATAADRLAKGFPLELTQKIAAIFTNG